MKKNLRWMLFTTALLVSMAVIKTGMASPATTVAVVPSEVKDKEPGESFKVNITVTDVVISETPPISQGLYGWSVNMTFNPDILNCTSVEEGPFLKQFFETIFAWNINNTAGFAFIGGMFKPPPTPPQGATGSGVLATVTFKVKGRGETSLRLQSLKLRTVIAGQNWEMENITSTDGVFRNVAPSILSLELIVAIIVAIPIVGGVAAFMYRRRKTRMKA